MQRSYQNPFHLEGQWNGNQLGDPYLFRYNGYTYLYCSSHQAQIKCWRSENLVDWDYLGSVCDLPEIHGAYAPEINYFQGKFYMITSPVGSGHYLLRADRPEGPFELVSENFGLLIDGSLFVDDDGREYLLRAGHQGIEIHDMPTPDLPEIHGTVIQESYLNHWTEGPMILKRDGYYFLTYTGNHLISRGYRICYSVSQTAPDAGYVNLRNQTLLLEVGDEFHALGHSSSSLGPDLDSCYIAYHSFDFRPEKPFRSLNIDRLFFNGARMYTNATWWPEDAPALPAFSARDGQGLTLCPAGEAGPQGLSTPAKMYRTPAIDLPCTLEACLPGGLREACLTLGDALHLIVNASKATLRAGLAAQPPLLHADLPPAIDLGGPLTLRIQLKENHLSLYLNALYIGEVDLPIPALTRCAFALGDDRGAPPSFVALSPVAFGNGDAAALKSIPGRFDAVHSLDPAPTEAFTERGMTVYGVPCGPESRLAYTLNVQAAGEYRVFVRLRQQGPVTFLANGSPLSTTSCAARDEDGFALHACGILSLPQGKTRLELSGFSAPALLDHLVLVPWAAPQACAVVKEGRAVHEDLRILGHKQEKSMLRKVYGFTCAENHGFAFLGEDGWTDYDLEAELNLWDPTGNGSASIFLRATRESWFAHQVDASLFGYRVLVDAKGLHLYRCAYGQELLWSAAYPWSEKQRLRLRVQVRGAEITVQADDAPPLRFVDADQHPYGKIGMEVRGEGYGFETLTLTPAQ